MHVIPRRGRSALDWRVTGALVTVYLAWGATYPAIRVMVETVPPLVGTGARFLVAGVLLHVFLALRRGRWRVWSSRRELVGAGAIGIVILGDVGLLALAEQEVPAGLAALVIASVPVWVVVLRLLNGERVARGALAAVVLGIGGVALLVLPGERSGAAPVDWLLVLVLAAVIEAAGQFSYHRAPVPADALASTTIQMTADGMALLLVGVALGESLHVERFSGAAVAAFAFLVGPGSLLAYTAFVWLLAHAPISLVSTYAYVNPLVAVLLGWALLSEQVTGVIAAGALAILASVALIVRRDDHARPASARPTR